jgi:hypothetical protein
MKTRFLLLIGAFAMSVASCSTDVDLFAEQEDIPVIYGLLDCDADTNYIRITHCIYASDNPLQEAANAAMSDYPGKLDVRLTEFCNGDSIRQIILDTITLHNKKPGTFYAPNHKVYYTAEHLSRNTGKNKYRYKLTIVFPDRTLTTEADLVGSNDFGPKSGAVNFSQTAFGVRIPFYFRPALNATIYSVDMSFTYHERRTSLSDTIPHTFMWHIGTFYEYDLLSQMEGDNYVLFYRPEFFYAALIESVGADTAVPGLKRFLTDVPVTLSMTAGGEHLRQYLYYIDMVNPTVPSEMEFTTIEGARGCFSSKMTKIEHLPLAGTTLPELIADDRWGFEFMGGSEP